jgi:hypothetical protein
MFLQNYKTDFKKVILVKSILAFAVTNHNGAQHNFGPPVFS